jgi:hypothetical protein
VRLGIADNENDANSSSVPQIIIPESLVKQGKTQASFKNASVSKTGTVYVYGSEGVISIRSITVLLRSRAMIYSARFWL